MHNSPFSTRKYTDDRVTNLSEPANAVAQRGGHDPPKRDDPDGAEHAHIELRAHLDDEKARQEDERGEVRNLLRCCVVDKTQPRACVAGGERQQDAHGALKGTEHGFP